MNGPPVQLSEHLINKAVVLQKEKKQRRKLQPPSRFQLKERFPPPNLVNKEREMVEITPMDQTQDCKIEDLEQR